MQGEENIFSPNAIFKDKNFANSKLAFVSNKFLGSCSKVTDVKKEVVSRSKKPKAYSCSGGDAVMDMVESAVERPRKDYQ